jgi:hypothetical protein
MLTAFAEWVLEEAARTGKRRLYFLSRDGWIIYRAAQLLASQKQTDIDLRYLKVSRFSLRSAEYHLLGEQMYDRICGGGIDITFDKVMRRANLSEAEAAKIKEQAAQRTGEEDLTTGILGYRKLQKLKGVLRDIPEFRVYVNQHAKDCYADTVGYLMQEGMGEELPYAVVDSGWIGTIQQSLEHLINKKIDGYYFGLYELPPEADPGQYHSYFFAPKDHIRRKARFSNCLFEAVCSSPEGMVLGYRKDILPGTAIRYLPVESKNKNPNRERMERNRTLLEQYLKHYPADNPHGNTPVQVIAKLLGTLMARPCAFEAEAMGSLLFCDDVLEMQMQKVAAELSDEELKKHGFLRKILIKCGIRKETLRESGWLAASIAACGKFVRTRLLAAECYQYLMYGRKALIGK